VYPDPKDKSATDNQILRDILIKVFSTEKLTANLRALQIRSQELSTKKVIAERYPIMADKRGAFNVYKIANAEAFIVQAFGEEYAVDSQCDRCRSGKGVFIGCVAVEGVLHGSCGNCAFGGSASRCSFRDAAAIDLTPRKTRSSKPGRDTVDILSDDGSHDDVRT
jgi:hypothetical protein